MYDGQQFRSWPTLVGVELVQFISSLPYYTATHWAVFRHFWFCLGFGFWRGVGHAMVCFDLFIDVTDLPTCNLTWTTVTLCVVAVVIITMPGG